MKSRNERMDLRLSEQDKQKLKLLAQHFGFSMTDAIRMALTMQFDRTFMEMVRLKAQQDARADHQ